MKKITLVPWWHIRELAYGPWDWALNPFLSWLGGVKTPVIVLPRPEDEHSRFDLGMACSTIKEHARARGLVVLSEERLLKHIIQADSKPVFVPPSPFASINLGVAVT